MNSKAGEMLENAWRPTMTSRSVFISYSHADDELATALCGIFASMRSITPFFSADKRFGIPGGSVWFSEINKALSRVDGLALLATPSSVGEAWPLYEVGAVAVRSKPALSVMIGLAPTELPGPLREVQAVAASVDHETLKHRLADAVGAPLEDVWTDESGKKLELFQALVARYRPPQGNQKVIVTAAAMQIVTLGPRRFPENAIVLTVVNHNDWAIRVTSASLEFPDLTPEGKVRGIMPAMNTLPAIVPPHDSAKFVFPEDGLADARAIGIRMKAHASLSTGEVIYADKPVVLEQSRP